MNPHQQGSYHSSRRHVRMPRKRPLSAHAVLSEHGRVASTGATHPLRAVIRMPKPRPASAKLQHRDSHGKPLQPHVVIRMPRPASAPRARQHALGNDGGRNVQFSVDNASDAPPKQLGATQPYSSVRVRQPEACSDTEGESVGAWQRHSSASAEVARRPGGRRHSSREPLKLASSAKPPRASHSNNWTIFRPDSASATSRSRARPSSACVRVDKQGYHQPTSLPKRGQRRPASAGARSCAQVRTLVSNSPYRQQLPPKHGRIGKRAVQAAAWVTVAGSSTADGAPTVMPSPPELRAAGQSTQACNAGAHVSPCTVSPTRD